MSNIWREKSLMLISWGFSSEKLLNEENRWKKVNSTFKFNYNVPGSTSHISDKVQNFQLEVGCHKESQETKDVSLILILIAVVQ